MKPRGHNAEWLEIGLSKSETLTLLALLSATISTGFADPIVHNIARNLTRVVSTRTARPRTLDFTEIA